MGIINSPDGMVVSMRPSLTDRKPMPRLRNSSISSTKVIHRTATSIESPYDERVALLQIGEASAEARAIGLRARYLIGIDVVLGDAQADERIHLEREVTVVGADTRIADQATVENRRNH